MTLTHPYRLLLRTAAPDAPGGVVALDESPARPITHITGPSGGGKSVLARLMAEAFISHNADTHLVWLAMANPAEGPNKGTDPTRVTVLRGARDPRTDQTLVDPHTALGLDPATRVLVVIDEVAYGLVRSYRGDPQFVSLREPLEAFVAAQRPAVDHAGPGVPSVHGVAGPRARLVLISQHPLNEDLYGARLVEATGTRVLARRCTTTAWNTFAGPFRDSVPAWAVDQMGHQMGSYWIRSHASEPAWFPCRVPVEDSARIYPDAA